MVDESATAQKIRKRRRVISDLALAFANRSEALAPRAQQRFGFRGKEHFH